MLRRVPPDEACGGAMGFSPWGSTSFYRMKGNVDLILTLLLGSLFPSDDRRLFPELFDLIHSGGSIFPKSNDIKQS
jgi:hypothetical protein